MPDIVILGAGVMGSAMTLPAAHKGARVTLVGTHLDVDIVRSVAETGVHPGLGIRLPSNVTALQWTDFGAAVANSPDLLIIGVSAAGVRWAIDRIVEDLRTPLPILIITKGVAPGNGSIEILPSVIAREVEARAGLSLPVSAVGGPCIAGELAAMRDTSVVIAGSDPALLARILGYLEAPFYHRRLSTDLLGVEICAAFKNFYAIAVGSVLGMLEREGKAGNGAVMNNLAASAFCQALTEMTILVETLGGDPKTATGLAGAGDLYVTCLAGRNGRLGRLLGLGHAYSAAKRTYMAADTIEGAQLALEIGPTLNGMMTRGTLPADRLPLAAAIVSAICNDAPLRLEFDAFARP